MRNVYNVVVGEPKDIAEITRKIADGDLSVQLTYIGNETAIYLATRDMTDRFKDTLIQIMSVENAQTQATIDLPSPSEQANQNVLSQHNAIDQVATVIQELHASA